MKKLFSLLLAICLIAGLLPVVASAAGETAKVSVVSSASGDMTKLEVAEGGTTQYMITDADGLAHIETANADNYNIKLEWVSGGKPTLYLKGAKLVAPETKRVMNISGTAEEVVICTEQESSMESTKSDIILQQGTHLRFTGDAKLNMTVNGNGFGVNLYQSDVKDMGPKYDITLDDANIELTMNLDEGAWGAGFGNHSRDFTVDGGTLKANIQNSSTFYSNTPGQNSNLYITNSPEIELMMTGGKTASFSRVENGIYIDSGNIKIRHGGTSAFYAGKEFQIYGGTIDCVGGPFSYSPTTVKLDFGDYAENCTVVVCNSVDGKGAVQYDPEKSAQQDRYVYFKITPGVSYEVAVKNGTADKSVVNSGETVTITARIAPEGKVFDKWEINEGDIKLADPAAMTTTFVMPKENVKVTATYKDDPTQVEDDPEPSTEESTPEESLPHVSLPDESTPDESTPDASTPDTDNDEGNKKPATSNKGNGGFIALFIIMIVVLVLAIAAVVVFTIITMKKMGIQLFKAKAPAEAIEAAAEETEEATEETAEDAE